MCVFQSQSFQYPSLPEVRGKGQNDDEHDDWSSSNQRWRRRDGDPTAAGGSKCGAGCRAGSSERTHHPTRAERNDQYRSGEEASDFQNPHGDEKIFKKSTSQTAPNGVLYEGHRPAVLYREKLQIGGRENE